MRRGHGHASTIAVVALAITTAGCGAVTDQIAEGVAEEAAEQAAGGDAEVDLDGGGVSVETSEGSFSAGSGGEVPEDFPDSIPLPDEYTVLSVVETEEDGGRAQAVQVQTAGTVSEYDAFYADGLEAAGWQLDDEVFTAEQRAQSIESMGTSNIRATRDGDTLLVGVLEGNDEGTVHLVLNLFTSTAGS